MVTKNRTQSDKIYLVQAGLILSLIIFISFLKCIYDEQQSKENFLNERKGSIYQKVENAFELFKHLELRLHNNKNDEKALLSILKSNHNGKVLALPQIMWPPQYLTNPYLERNTSYPSVSRKRRLNRLFSL